MNQYTDIIRKWATDTRRAGHLSDADGIGEVGLNSTEIGRRLAVRFTLKVDIDRIADARYEVFGCGFSMATCAVAADMAIGYTLDDIQNIDAKRLDAALEGLPPERDYCANLAVEALHAAALSVQRGSQKVEASLSEENDHGPRVSEEHPVYAKLINSPRPASIFEEDRHLFACLIAVTVEDSSGPEAALGLGEDDFRSLLGRYFPDIGSATLSRSNNLPTGQLPECNSEVLSLILSHVPTKSWQGCLQTSVWLAHILAARTALPGHLWVAMGLTERPQLTAAIRRHLPSLADANNQNMRWKRFLYKQVCNMNGGTMCKAPNCGVCSDYSLCFAD